MFNNMELTQFTFSSMAIVAMTSSNATVTNSTTEEEDGSIGDGEYDWTIGQRGLLLSGFFYLYIITQIPGQLFVLNIFSLTSIP